MEKEDHLIQTNVFEGPLSVLLELVQKRKIFINDIALADIAEEFIQMMQDEQTGRELSREASFIQIAATLLLLKSKSLLPHFVITEEEEESTLELARRLEMFERIRSYASHLELVYGKQIFSAGKAENRDDLQSPVFSPEERFNGALFLERIVRVQDDIPKKSEPQHVSVKQTVRLEDVLRDLSGRIKKHVALSFREFAHVEGATRSDIVVHFIALLELVKQGFIEAEQRDARGDIELRHKEITVPNYS
ncbi:MAG: segregation/condensation protein A [Candidatus Paceibacterota bacterium]